MLNKKGLTLIEVILSIAIIGLIAVSFLPSLTNHFKWMKDTKKNITQKAFESQEELEQNVNIIKALLTDLPIDQQIDSADFVSLGISLKISNIKLFESKYPIAIYPYRKYPDIYRVESILNADRKFITMIGNKRLPELAVPEIRVDSINFIKDGVLNLGNFEYFNYLNNTSMNLKITATSNMFNNPQNSFNRYRHDWYVSKPGFNIPVPKNVLLIDEDFDMGRIYPRFPDDYIASPVLSELGNAYSYISMTERTITTTLANNLVSQYPGRHILYTITPFAKSLKKGKTATILPLYIYGPDETNDLAVHLDASTINKADRYHATTNPSGAIQNDSLNVRQWKNNRPSIKAPKTANNAIQNTVDKMPIIKTSDISGAVIPEIPFQTDGTNYTVWGRSLGNKDANISSMKISTITSLNNNFSIFMIIRKVKDPSAPTINNPILSGTGTVPWSLGWINDVNSPQLALKINNVNSAILSQTLSLNDWYLVQISSNNAGSILRATSLKSGGLEPVLNATGTSGSLNTTTIDINWNGVEISEILIYDKNIGTTNIKKVEDFLKLKYNPYP